MPPVGSEYLQHNEEGKEGGREGWRGRVMWEKKKELSLNDLLGKTCLKNLS